MIAQGAGKIVNVAALGGTQGGALMAAYVASKSAVIRLTESMALELRDKGINVNCVLPSTIEPRRPTARHAQGRFHALGRAGGAGRRDPVFSPRMQRAR